MIKILARALSRLFLIFVILALLLPAGMVGAQESESDSAVYIVQAGDSLWAIAQRFRVTVDELQRVNRLANAGQIGVGDQLLVPGLDWYRGELTTVKAPYGDSLRSLSRRYQIPQEELARLNHLTSPLELHAGFDLVIPAEYAQAGLMRRGSLKPGQSMLELAILQGENPHSIAAANSLQSQWEALPGDVLRLPGEGDAGPGALPVEVREVVVSLENMVQGKTAVIRVLSDEELSLSGSLIDRDLQFFSEEQGKYSALQGIHAMTPSAAYPLTIQGTLGDGTLFNFTQFVYVRDGDYVYEAVPGVDPVTLDPTVTLPEDEQWKALAQESSPERLWSGKFQFPSPPEWYDCWPSTFGRRRSYNGSEYKYFHTGLDVCGPVGAEIYAPASGVVVFVDELVVRGIATMINHGWGIYSGYMHQSETLVQVGERVETGQLIGLVGATGRVTGPHLHWEIWAGGVQVEPMDWMEQEYP